MVGLLPRARLYKMEHFSVACVGRCRDVFVCGTLSGGKGRGRALPDAICVPSLNSFVVQMIRRTTLEKAKNELTTGPRGSRTSRQKAHSQSDSHAPDGWMSRIWRSATSSLSRGLRGKLRHLQATCRSGRTRTAPESSVPEKFAQAR